MDAMDLQYLLGLAGTVAFAVTAVLAVTPKGIDLFGAVVMGLITAIGGGTIRDLILGVPVFWSSDLSLIWVAIGSSVIAFYLPRLATQKYVYKSMLYIDALGVAMFAIQAGHKVDKLAFAMPLGPILLGIITAIGGGLLRDMLAGNQTLLMKKELYAFPVMIGLIFYTILVDLMPDHMVVIGLGCSIFIFLYRAAAIYWKLEMPKWMVVMPKQTT